MKFVARKRGNHRVQTSVGCQESAGQKLEITQLNWNEKETGNHIAGSSACHITPRPPEQDAHTYSSQVHGDLKEGIGERQDAGVG